MKNERVGLVQYAVVLASRVKFERKGSNSTQRDIINVTDSEKLPKSEQYSRRAKLDSMKLTRALITSALQ